LALAAAGACALGLATIPVPAVATPVASAAQAKIEYAVGKPLCPRAKAARSSCFAERRVLVRKGTKGARAFAVIPATTPAGAALTGPAGGLSPAGLSSAYKYNPAATVSGQTVAIVDAYNDPTIESDLQVFDTQYGLPACTTANGCFTKVNQVGAASPLPGTDVGWAGEIALDVETVHAVCQNCKILLVEANDNFNANLEAAVNEAVALHATAISNSWGGIDPAPSATDLSAFKHPGIVITASTGDDGYYNYDRFSADNAPNFPAELNTVVAVGGTSLYLNQSGTRQSETVWNDNGQRDFWQSQMGGYAMGASGGGCSVTQTAQGWQIGVSDWAGTACGTHRLAADISSDADYITGFDTYDTTGASGWGTIGGTSLASPTVAALFALAGGAHGVSYPALTLYGHLGKPAALYDVTTGGDGWCDGEGAPQCGDPNSPSNGIVDCDYPASGTTPTAGDLACDAATGYDGATGVGTPNGLAAFAKTGPAATITGPSSVAHGTASSWTASATDPFPGGVITSYAWNWGDGMTATGAAPPAHTYSAGGVTRTITLTVKDNYGITTAKTLKVTVS
jgi:hypothetical protein